jgi:DNA repair ATPase RecN
MSQNHSEQSSFDKNLRSFLEAVSMFEREAGLVMDRFGFDTDSIGRVLDTLGSLSAEAVRPLASVLGLADAAAVEALARDVRALLQSEARARREQASSAARMDEILAAVEALGATTAGLADLQARTQDRLDALAAKVDSMPAVRDERSRALDEVEGLTRRLEDLERRLAAELGLADDGAAGTSSPPPGVKPSGARRAVSRAIQSAAGSAKILEGLPTLDPKARPA